MTIRLPPSNQRCGLNIDKSYIIVTKSTDAETMTYDTDSESAAWIGISIIVRRRIRTTTGASVIVVRRGQIVFR